MACSALLCERILACHTTTRGSLIRRRVVVITVFAALIKSVQSFNVSIGYCPRRNICPALAAITCSVDIFSALAFRQRLLCRSSSFEI